MTHARPVGRPGAGAVPVGGGEASCGDGPRQVTVMLGGRAGPVSGRAGTAGGDVPAVDGGLGRTEASFVTGVCPARAAGEAAGAGAEADAAGGAGTMAWPRHAVFGGGTTSDVGGSLSPAFDGAGPAADQ